MSNNEMKGINIQKKAFKSGFVSIIGGPNVGKSTLLNLLVGEKISIVSDKPQTTRNKITGILHLPAAQVVFLDTPGIHENKKKLNEFMVKSAITTLKEVDLIIFMVEANKPFTNNEELILKSLINIKVPVLLVINKVDLVSKESILPIIEKYAQAFPFKEIIPISCISSKPPEQVLKELVPFRVKDFKILIEALLNYIPEGPAYFPDDIATDVTARFIVGEIIREKVFRMTKQEVPYATAVTIDEFKEDEERKMITILATINVEKNSQKGIIIGKGGLMLKNIGSSARKDIEQLLGSKVFLKLFVRVQKDWSKDLRALKEFGYR
jgi:GTP-binding protein Era